MKDQIVPLSLLYREGKIGLDEFADRVQAMLEDPGQAMNIAIDVEHLEHFRRDHGD